MIALERLFRVRATSLPKSRRVQPSRKLHVDCLEDRTTPATGGIPTDIGIESPSYDPSRILVRWEDGLARSAPNFTRTEPLGNGIYRVTLAPKVSVTDALRELRQQSSVEIAQPDYRVHIAAVPNDPKFSSSWGPNNTGQDGGLADADIDATEAWDVTTGTRNTIVAVIDTGIEYRHPDLTANMWLNIDEIDGNSIDDDANGYVDDIYGWDFVGNTPNVLDDNGHGTHVAGTIGAVGNNGIGTTGVSWNTRLMALKFLDADGGGFTSDAILAINYAVANGAKVINASYGGGAYDDATIATIKSARDLGVIVVAAAGNEKSDTDFTPNFPSNYPQDNVISVAATDRNDKLAWFSNFGDQTVDIAAPGEDIYSTVLGNRYAFYSGTSMATPHVAGAVALVWDAHPTWTYRQVIGAILQTADPLPVLNGKVASGRLNVADAIVFDGASLPATSTPTEGPIVTGVEFAGKNTQISRAQVTFSKPINPDSFTLGDVQLLDPKGKVVKLKRIAFTNFFDFFSDTGVQRFNVEFSGRKTPGTYTLKIGPDIQDMAGNSMDENQNGVLGEGNDGFSTTRLIPKVKTFASGNVKLPVPDLGLVVSEISVEKDITIRDLDVKLNVKHLFAPDLRLTLIAPNGTSIILFHEYGSFFDTDMKNTIFDDESSEQMVYNFAPFTGRFAPEEPLSLFDGMNAKGLWQLVVEDRIEFDSGVLTNWSLLIGQAPGDLRPAATQAARVSTAPPVSVEPSIPPSFVIDGQIVESVKHGETAVRSSLNLATRIRLDPVEAAMLRELPEISDAAIPLAKALPNRLGLEWEVI